MSNRTVVASLLALVVVTGCKKQKEQVAYQAVPVERRDIIVSAQAAGTIQPDTVVEVKSKASGEILEIHVQTGQEVKRGDLMVEVDKRVPRNNLAQAQADLEVARAQLTNAESKKRRADELFQSKSITQEEHEQAALDFASAKSTGVRAQVSVETAQDQLDDTKVLAPISGTIISLLVSRGAVISSPTSAVGEGTILLTMADLDLVQVKTLVDETDIGKIKPGMRATVTVDAFPNRPFEGEVLKIEPLAEVQQNVTMFPVLIRIQNQQKLLKPGMNTEVEIHIGRRDSVLAIPNAALRTQRDVASAAQVLGLDPHTVEQQLAEAEKQAPQSDSGNGRTSLGASTPGSDSTAKPGSTLTMPNGRTINLPAGVDAAQIKAIMDKRMKGEELSAADRAVMQKAFAGMRGNGGGMRRNGNGDAALNGGNYIVFVKRGTEIKPVHITTGLTDLDYSEVTKGLEPTDSVLLLPSAGLIQSQQEFQQRVNQMTGGGGVPGMRSNTNSSSGSSSTSGGGRRQ
jgi:HlyD family secretion protein